MDNVLSLDSQISFYEFTDSTRVILVQSIGVRNSRNSHQERLFFIPDGPPCIHSVTGNAKMYQKWESKMYHLYY